MRLAMLLARYRIECLQVFQNRKLRLDTLPCAPVFLRVNRRIRIGVKIENILPQLRRDLPLRPGSEPVKQLCISLIRQPVGAWLHSVARVQVAVGERQGGIGRIPQPLQQFGIGIKGVVDAVVSTGRCNTI